MGNKKGKIKKKGLPTKVTVSAHQLRGQSYQTLFSSIAMRKGYIVEEPTVPCPWDYTLRNVHESWKNWRVQVKGTEGYTHGHCDRYRITLKHGAKNTLTSINPNFVDVVACYVENYDVWYNIPVTALTSKKAMYLYPHNRESTGQYECWKHDWSVFNT